LGVLIEKAKTTPENYPLSLNALKNGCNQKNNRAPLMQVEEDQVDAALETLRQVGAVALIQGGGRVDKFRHLAYEWLGVEKVELAVMAELLLRGAQTVGELRGRAARMEPIKDLAELRPVLEALVAKGLIQYLSPEGRGAMVTHTLYLEREMDKVRREAAEFATVPESSQPAAPPTAARHVPHSAAVDPGPAVGQLREDVAALRRELIAVRSEFESTTEELRRDLEELQRQLGN
jgi:uncharacterized protein